MSFKAVITMFVIGIEGKTSLNLLFISTIEPLIISLWWQDSKSKDRWCESWLLTDLDFSSECKIWLWESKWALNWALLLSLQRCKWMGISLAIASPLKEGEVQNVPRIQMAALHCILLSFLREYDNGTLL